MKKTRFVLLIFSALLVVLPGCKKKLFDRRNKYIGDYTFTYSYHYFQGGTQIDTSIFYSGSIDYGSKGEIKVSWTALIKRLEWIKTVFLPCAIKKWATSMIATLAFHMMKMFANLY